MIEYLFNFQEVRWLLAWESLLLMGVCLVLLWGSKAFISWGHQGIKIDYHLVKEDNPAVAVTVAGYFLAVGIILHDIVSSPVHRGWKEWNFPFPDYSTPILDMIYWFLLATVLLYIAGVVNDRFLLHRFRNLNAIVKNRNIGAGVTQAGSYLASAFMISVIIAYGDENHLFLETGLVIFYFFILQLALIIFSKIYIYLLPYDLHKAMETNNPAPGIGLGLALIAMGMILSYPLKVTGNLWVLLFWFVNGMVLLLLTRWILNYGLFRQADLNQEIIQDHNWGIALIEGVSLIGIALIIKSSF